MPTKSGLVLVRKDQIEACVSLIETRSIRAVDRPQPKVDMWDTVDKAYADFFAQTQMSIKDGIATIPIKGPITLDDPFAAFFGETSVKGIDANLEAALADPTVTAIHLSVNSPGGYVAGIEALSNKVFAARAQKPIYAYTESMAASAAYWIASAASKVFLASETSEVGSIGVYMVHFDYSGMLKDVGIKVTEVTAGEYKGLGSPYTELSAEDKKLLQADADYVYSRFVEAVARNRGLSVKEVLKSANGLTFFGSDSVQRGLSDGIATSQEVTAMTKEEQDKLNQEEARKKAEAEQAALTASKVAALEAQVADQTTRLAAYAATEAAAAQAATTTEAQAAYKAAFGREATTEEVTHYCKLDAAGRKLHKANLEETAKNRDDLAKKAGLFTEVAGDGTQPARKDGDNLILAAAKGLGFTTAAPGQ